MLQDGLFAGPKAATAVRGTYRGPTAPERKTAPYTPGPFDRKLSGYREYRGQDAYRRIRAGGPWAGYTIKASAEIRAMSDRGLIATPETIPW